MRGTAMDDADFRPANKAERMEELPLFGASQNFYGHYQAERDLLRLKGAAARILALLLDGEWHTLAELRTVGGASGDRRARELRELGFGFDVERDPAMPFSSGIFRYRLAHITPERVAHALDHFGDARSDPVPPPTEAA